MPNDSYKTLEDIYPLLEKGISDSLSKLISEDYLSKKIEEYIYPTIKEMVANRMGFYLKYGKLAINNESELGKQIDSIVANKQSVILKEFMDMEISKTKIKEFTKMYKEDLIQGCYRYLRNLSDTRSKEIINQLARDASISETFNKIKEMENLLNEHAGGTVKD